MVRNPPSIFAELFYQAIRKKEDRRIGLETEQLGMLEHKAIPYSGNDLSIQKLAASLLEKFPGAIVSKWKDQLLGFEFAEGAVSLEPGAQLEFSHRPLQKIASVVRVIDEFNDKLISASGSTGAAWPALGVNPFQTADEIKVIPAPRYQVMTRYMERQGKLATSMMRLTTSIQINLDYSSEKEAIEMLQVGLGIAPISYALFGNSPFYAGRESGLLSYRGAIWMHTDSPRVGLLPQAFEKGFGFEQYAKILWNLPLMYQRTADGGYVEGTGASLADLAEESEELSPDELRLGMQQLFTEARLKSGYMEVRSVDGLPRKYRYAATAFWVGLLYHEPARSFALDLVRSASADERQSALISAIHTGLKGSYGKNRLHTVSGELLSAAKEGLKNRGFGEEIWLEPLYELVDSRENLAERLVQQLRQDPKRDLKKLLSTVDSST